MKVTLKHLRRKKYCNRGARIWFETYGLDFNEFRLNGIDVDVLRKIGDPMGMNLVKLAEDDGRQ